MNSYQQQVAGGSFLSNFRSMLSDPKLQKDMRFVLPFLLGLFALVFFLKHNTTGFVFIVSTASSACVVYFMFEKLNLSRYVTVDLYRLVLFFGVIVILISSPYGSMGKLMHSPVSTASVEVQKSTVNIRQEPSTDSGVVTKVSKGDKLKVLDSNGSWYKVETASGEKGWVYSSLVNKLQS